MGYRTALLLVLVLLMYFAAPTLSSLSQGTPVFFRGSVVGCAEQPVDLIAELRKRFDTRLIYFFGISGCLECAEMDSYLRSFTSSENFAYIDITEYGDLFKKLIDYLSQFVEDQYLSEVPIVVVYRDASVTAISIGVFRDDSYWESTLFGARQEVCEVTPIKPQPRSVAGTVAGAVALGLASAFSPCVMYLYVTLLLSYTASALRRPLIKLLSFVLGLGLGYLLILVGLSSLLRFLRPFTWIFFIGFGLYMVLHSRGVLGCLIGGRACRDLGHPLGSGLASILGSFFPLLLGVAASFSATPCSAGYFVLLQTATGDQGSSLTTAIVLAYLGAFIFPYLVFSILSSRLINALEKFLSKAGIIEFSGGMILILAGIYLALAT